MTRSQPGQEYVWWTPSISIGLVWLRIRVMFNIPLDEADRQNDPEEIRSLSKKQLHKSTGIRKVLPDLDARCCTRAYPIRVHLDEVYSASREKLLTFEARLQPD